MDIQQYIYSGVLEEYCLGMLDEEQQASVVQMSMLYPRVKEELNSIELAFEYFAQDNTIKPRPEVRDNIIRALQDTFSDSPLKIDNLPEINKRSDHESWFKCVEHLIPAVLEDFNLQVLRNDEKISQMLVISRLDVPEESHSDLMESLFILKGECLCTIGDKEIHMQAGDFIEIPLHTDHDVKVLSPYVIAIVQHKAVA